MYEQPFNPYVKNLSAVKEYFKSRCVLVLGLSRALGAILSLVTAILISTNLPKILAYIKSLFLWVFDETGAPYGISANFSDLFDRIVPSDVSSSIVSSSISSTVVTILIAAAFLIIYFKSRSNDPNATPNAGVTILYVFAIIALVGVIIAIVAAVVLIVFMFLLYSKLSSEGIDSLYVGVPFIDDLLSYSWTPTSLLALTIAGIVLLVFAGFIALFIQINRLRYYGSIRKSLNTVELQNKGAKPFGVMCLISAFSAGLSLLSTPAGLFAKTPVTAPKILTAIAVFSMLAQAASVVGAIMEAKLAMGYKTYIDGIKYGYSRHAAPAAPFAPFPSVNPAEQNPSSFNPYVSRTSYDGEPSTDNTYSDPYGSDLTGADAAPDAYNAPFSGDSASYEETAPLNTATCSVCGAEVDPDAPFCGNCGNRL